MVQGRLEESLNAQLLYRTTRKLSLTDAGRTLYNKAKIAKFAFQEAENAVTGYGEDMKGNIRITMPAVSANLILSESIAEFCKQHPEISVDVQITNRLVDLIEEGFDLAIRTAFQRPEKMSLHQPLGRIKPYRQLCPYLFPNWCNTFWIIAKKENNIVL